MRPSPWPLPPLRLLVLAAAASAERLQSGLVRHVSGEGHTAAQHGAGGAGWGYMLPHSIKWGYTGVQEVMFVQHLSSDHHGDVYAATVTGCPGVPEDFRIAVKHVLTNRIAIAEARFLDLLQGVGVVKYLHHAPPFIAMELADKDLAEVARYRREDERFKLYVPDETVVARQLLSTLALMHGRGIVHRNLQLQNVLLCCRGNETAKTCHTRITDLGSACSFGNDAQVHCGATAIAPGEWDRWPVEAWLSATPTLHWGSMNATLSDIWALGIVLCELHLGRSCRPDFDGYGYEYWWDVSTRALNLEGGAGLLHAWRKWQARGRLVKLMQMYERHVQKIVADEAIRDSWLRPLLARMMSVRIEGRCSAAECLDLVPVAGWEEPLEDDENSDIHFRIQECLIGGGGSRLIPRQRAV